MSTPIANNEAGEGESVEVNQVPKSLAGAGTSQRAGEYRS